MPTLHHRDPVFVLELGADENRFSPDWLNSVHGMLDTVSGHGGPAALVTVGQGRFYSNGLDLEWLVAHAEETQSYVRDVHELFARVLTLPVPTVAAVNGHAFGAGAMLAMAHDARVMRADRGYFCFPEADINIPFTPGMAALIQSKLTPASAIASMTTARRFGGPEAEHAGLVDAVVAESELLDTACERVRALAGKDKGTLGAIKNTMFATVVSALRSES
ncbi:enoyl-CoA hydratase/isomerase family protein [Saccharomonospora xinjiangensis]|uniref:enoyl-CoA hydratase/isomerase family protein n=1 Tax=Saccharomonospora xinjiangensis TaxID=75294 RepID=UPI0035108155